VEAFENSSHSIKGNVMLKTRLVFLCSPANTCACVCCLSFWTVQQFLHLQCPLMLVQ